MQDMNEPVKTGIDLDVISNVLNDKAEETGKIKRRNKIKTEKTYKRMTDFIVDESVN